MWKRAWVFLVVGVVASLTALGQQPLEYYLTGNLKEVPGTVATDKGEQRTSFSGAIGFRVTMGPKGELIWSLIRLNLVAKGVPTEKGDSGTIGLVLADYDHKATYDPRTGRLTAEFRATLHYELIDRVKGYRELGVKGEQDLFAPYTEEMVGKLSGKLPESLQAAEKGSALLSGDVRLDLSSPVLGAVRSIDLAVSPVLVWVFRFAETLRIQPVFIGTGPTDPARTGTAWATLIARSHEIWNKCGTVRCLKLVVNQPIYLNKPAYRVLDTDAEITALRAEVDVANAVEVFVVERWATALACSTGGGACWSSGTASAKIVTSDQQLAVPCPCPAACTGYCPCGPCACGALNLYHLAHELGHALNLAHPPGPSGSLAASTVGSNMEPSGFCCDNPGIQSAKNCRNASNPLLYWEIWSTRACGGRPDIAD